MSNDSVRESNDCRGFICGAYELLLWTLDACECTFDAHDPFSVSVGVSVRENSCGFEASTSTKQWNNG